MNDDRTQCISKDSCSLAYILKQLFKIRLAGTGQLCKIVLHNSSQSAIFLLSESQSTFYIGALIGEAYALLLIISAHLSLTGKQQFMQT